MHALGEKIYLLSLLFFIAHPPLGGYNIDVIGINLFKKKGSERQ